jgi:hypothetical protein
MPLEKALQDLRLRIANYEKVYEPIADDALSYLKLINLNSKVIANRVRHTDRHRLSRRSQHAAQPPADCRLCCLLRRSTAAWAT